MSDHYILVDGEVKPAELMEWAEWFGNMDNRRIARTKVGSAEVSTVFLGLNHNWGDGPPLIFETMVFGGPLDEECERYSTLDEARRGHDHMVARVEESEAPK